MTSQTKTLQELASYKTFGFRREKTLNLGAQGRSWAWEFDVEFGLFWSGRISMVERFVKFDNVDRRWSLFRDSGEELRI